MHGRSLIRRSCVCALALSFLLGGNAYALDVKKVGTVLHVTAERGERNFLTVSQSGTTIRVQNSGPYDRYEPLIYPYAGAGCTSVPVPATEWSVAYSYATCSSVGLTRVEITLGAEPSGRVHAFEGPTCCPTEPLLLPTKITAPAYSFVYGTPAAPNELIALAGADLVGGAQDDLLVGGPHHDELSGEGGDDVVQGGPGPDTLGGGDGTDTLDGGAGEDTLIANPGGTDRVEGGADRDACSYSRYTPAGVAISLDGIANDGLRTGTRTGNFQGCEKLVGGEGPDLLTGSSGDDELVSGGCCARGESGPRDELRGLGGDDVLDTNSMRTLLDGGANDDRLLLDWGDDEAYGGSGTDVVDYRWDHSDPILADLDGAPGDDGRPSIDEHDTLGADIENLVGGGGDDTLGGNASANVLDGRRGADHYAGHGGSDTAVLDDFNAVAVDLSSDTGTGLSPYDGSPVDLTFDSIENVRGTAGPDLLIGDGTVNTLQGEYGDDLIEGGGGPDVLRGGPGYDAVSYADRTADVRIDLAAGTGGTPAEGDAFDSVEDAIGGEGADVLRGDGDSNVLEGGPGADTIDGRAGEDELYGDEDIDTIEARDGEADYIDCGDQGGTLFPDVLDEADGCTSPGSAPVPSPATQILRPPTPAPPTRGASPPATGLQVNRRLPSSVQRSALVRRGLRLRVHCTGNCTVAAVLRVKAGGRVLGRASGALAAGRWTTLTLRAKKPPKRLRSVRVELTTTDPEGRKQRATSVVRIRG